MYRTPSIALAALILTVATPAFATAQVSGIPENMRAETPPRQQLAGPRFGFTAFTGDVAEGRRLMGKSAVMSQFGWQFETQIVSSSSGHQALLEWVFLVGGVEQDEFNPSLAFLPGLRLPNGVEFGVGPNLSLSSETGDHTTSIVTAFGVTIPFGDIYIPANLAVSFAEGGPRFTTLVGWVIG
jgi:hypothetical protein